ncbi:MAG TPA: hypothetical protein VGE67_03145 [Haloferula sp.]
MKTISHILALFTAIVVGFAVVACKSAPAEAPAPATAATKAKPKWAFVEVGFQITREGKIREVKVLTSDAPEKARQQAMAYVRNYIPKPEIYNRVARQTFIYQRETGKFRPMRVEVHSSQRPDGG